MPLRDGSPSAAPEDTVVIAEVLRRVLVAVDGIRERADGCVNQYDLYLALKRAYEEAMDDAR